MCKRSRSFYILRIVPDFSPYWGPVKDKLAVLFYFRRGISNAICDPVLYLLRKGWNMSLIHDGTIQFQDLKIVVAMQYSTLSETGSQFIFLKWAAPTWERGGEIKQRRMYLFCPVLSLCSTFLLRRWNHDTQR